MTGRTAFCLLWTLLASAGISGAANWKDGTGFRTQELKITPTGRPFLQRLKPESTGLDFTNYVSELSEQANSLFTSGAGLAAGDVDGDGWCDLFFCGIEGRSALYRNLGDWKFEDISIAAGLNLQKKYLTAAAFADVDGDGDLDLIYNTTGDGSHLYLNDGKGHFVESAESGLAKRFGATGLALADIDGNGTLDLYVANYATTKIEDRPNARFETKTVDGKLVITSIDGVPMTSPELTNRYFVDNEKVVRELGEPDILYLNDGRGHFTPTSWTDGRFLDEQGAPLKAPPYDFGLSVMFHDMNGDGVPDLYVCNDLFPPDRIWLNDGHGHFRAMSNLALRNTSRFSMGVDFADINRDGIDDFFVVDMLSRDHQRRKVQTVGVPPMTLPIGRIDNRPQYRRNTLFMGRGDGTYAEIGHMAGLSATEWSWMPIFLDVDLDGYEDVLVTTGFYHDSLNADAVGKILDQRRGRKLSDEAHRSLKHRMYPSLHLPLHAFRNLGNLTFEDSADSWGFNFVGMSHGMCLADLDNDGDLDVIVNHLNDSIGVYRNEANAARISVRLKGHSPNTRGIGARLKVTGGPVTQTQEVISGGRYLASDDPIRMFAAKNAGQDLTVEVAWRSGARSVVAGIKPNTAVEIDEPTGPAPSKPPLPSLGKTLFEDVSDRLKHSHVDSRFEDFERQPLLERKLSQLGPGVTWWDVDGDGREDLIIGSGEGGSLALYLNRGAMNFERATQAPLNAVLTRDSTTILGWQKASGERVLLAGAANYEDGLPQGSVVRELIPAKQAVEENLPAWEISIGPMALADVDRDGQLDLFVGGRVVSGRYPESCSSLLFRGNGSGFDVEPEACKKLSSSGMVSGAVFSDLDGDGFSDLIVACDWGPVRVYKNTRGKLRDATRDYGIDKYLGWWNGVTTGDFDGDGRPDIIASNWGRNSKYESYRSQPWRIYFGEWISGGGPLGCLEGYFDNKSQKWVPWASFASMKAFPWALEHFPTQEAFGTASVADLLGDRAASTKILQANWLETTLFLNRGDHFEMRPLPIEAQLSPAFGLSVGDFNGDGHEDVFMSQNFYATSGDTPRYDAGRGLVLLGDGTGSFKTMPGQESGVQVYGEQRGSAVCDLDEDGRLDLVVTQNGNATRLFHNVTAQKGLRIRLAGPPSNPNGVGAAVRLMNSQGLGPVREIRAGGGYWSVDSSVQIMSRNGPAERVWVRWPDGTESTSAIPNGAREITISPGGQSKSLP